MPPYLDVVRQRCEEIGRDPATLALQSGTNPSQVYPGLRETGGQRMMGPGDFPTSVVRTSAEPQRSRPEIFAALAELGFSRIVAGVPGLANTFDTLDEFLEDWSAAGLPLPERPAATPALAR